MHTAPSGPTEAEEPALHEAGLVSGQLLSRTLSYPSRRTRQAQGVSPLYILLSSISAVYSVLPKEYVPVGCSCRGMILSHRFAPASKACMKTQSSACSTKRHAGRVSKASGRKVTRPRLLSRRNSCCLGSNRSTFRRHGRCSP